jgi:hypothetical protein
LLNLVVRLLVLINVSWISCFVVTTDLLRSEITGPRAGALTGGGLLNLTR